MKIFDQTPMLAVADMEESIRFYEDVLDFSRGDKFESGGETWWCELTRPEMRLMLTRHETHADAPGAREVFGQTSLCYYTDDVEGLHAQLREKGYAPSDLRVTFYRVKEFHLLDPAGYTILIGERTTDDPTTEEQVEDEPSTGGHAEDGSSAGESTPF